MSAVSLGLSPRPRLGTLLPREAGVTGGRRSAAKASVAVGSADAGGGTAKVFPKDKRLAVLLLGPRTSKAAALRAAGPALAATGSPARRAATPGGPQRALGPGATARPAATGVFPGRSSALPGNKSRRPR